MQPQPIGFVEGHAQRRSAFVRLCAPEGRFVSSGLEFWTLCAHLTDEGGTEMALRKVTYFEPVPLHLARWPQCGVAALTIDAHLAVADAHKAQV
jgi:hypothetical protein